MAWMRSRIADTTRQLITNSQPAKNEQIMVSVSDTGAGLPQQQADQVFNAFFITKPQGTGMGLCISRSIVESHGGRLWAADSSGRRASFHLTYPQKARRMNDTRSTVFVADNDDLVPAAIQGMPNSVGRYENSYTKV